MSRADRARQLAAFEKWADTVRSDELVAVDTSTLQTVLRLAEQRAVVDARLVAAVGEARSRGHSWSQIGLMLGVSKQAAQRKYGSCTPVA